MPDVSDRSRQTTGQFAPEAHAPAVVTLVGVSNDRLEIDPAIVQIEADMVEHMTRLYPAMAYTVDTWARDESDNDDDDVESNGGGTVSGVEFTVTGPTGAQRTVEVLRNDRGRTTYLGDFGEYDSWEAALDDSVLSAERSKR